MPPAHPHRRVKQLEIHFLWRKLQGKDESESEVAQSCPILWDPMDCSLPGFSIYGIFRARVLEWVTISFSRRSSRPRGWTRISHTAGRRFTVWAIAGQLREAAGPCPDHIFLILKSEEPPDHTCGKAPCWSKGHDVKRRMHTQEDAGIHQIWTEPFCAQSLSRVWLCDPTDGSPPGSSAQADSPARTLLWVATPSSRASSQPRDGTQVSPLQVDSLSTEPPRRPRYGLWTRQTKMIGQRKVRRNVPYKWAKVPRGHVSPSVCESTCVLCVYPRVLSSLFLLINTCFTTFLPCGNSFLKDQGPGHWPLV